MSVLPIAAAGSAYKADIRVSHGRERSPTARIRVPILKGIVAVKPQPNSGRQPSIAVGKLAQPYDAGQGRA